MLEIKNVRKTFNKNTINEKKALNGINLHLDEGDFVTVIGGNGAGKSTMLNMINGMPPFYMLRRFKKGKPPVNHTSFAAM